MFTGIIEETGEVAYVRKAGASATLSVKCRIVLTDARVGDSLAVDGACLTLVRIDRDHAIFDVSAETIKRSTVGSLKRGSRVNLERAARIGDRIGGHMVTGHVDGKGKITSKKKAGNGLVVTVAIPDSLSRYVIEKGSISIDGISLTVAGIKRNLIAMALIPHTIKTTTLTSKRTGAAVNIECDQLAKYVVQACANIKSQKSREAGLIAPLPSGYL